MKTQNIILAGVLIALGIGSYLFFTKKKDTEVVSDAEEKLKTIDTYSDKETQAEVGKSTIADVPVSTPITNVGGAVKNTIRDAVIEIVSEKTPSKEITEAKQISALIAENKRKQSGYKKASSKRNIQTVIDADIAKLLAMGYKPLANGEVQKI